ncbi:MAG: hypothetical protein R6U98_25800, partial [Pirellulaceae bacterium]
MKRSLLLIVLSPAVILPATTNVAHGQENGWLQRINPFRLLRDRTAARVPPTRSTDEPLTPSAAGGMHAPRKDALASRTRAVPHEAQPRRQWGSEGERNLQTRPVPPQARYGRRSDEESGFSANIPVADDFV